MTKICWRPNKTQIDNSQHQQFINIINKQYNKKLLNYFDLQEFALNNLAIFWQEFAEFAKIIFLKKSAIIIKSASNLYNYQWFPGAKLNFAENILKAIVTNNNQEIIIAYDEFNNRKAITHENLLINIRKIGNYLQSVTITKGDVVAGIMPNIIETIVAMLGTTAIGGIWTACSPDFGAEAILDRLLQVQPKVLFICLEYSYKNKIFNITDKINKIIQSLPSVKKIIIVDFLNLNLNLNLNFDYILYKKILNNIVANLDFATMDFADPVYIVYSSGTTGQPKCIIHTIGGVLLEHFKEHMLHLDFNYQDKLLYFTTCSWMMWHWQVSALAQGVVIVLYDGDPFYNNNILNITSKEQISILGVGAKYIQQLAKNGLIPKENYNFDKLRMILSTGSPLLSQNFIYVYNNIKQDLALCSISGGTDILGCFVLGNVTLPVYSGQIQCVSLGLDIKFFNNNNNNKGELICTNAFPSMPLGLLNDQDKTKYKQAYFRKINGKQVWAHGDYGKFTQEKGIIIYGRSDAVLNPGGVRIGTAEIYREVENIPEILEALAIGKKTSDDEIIILFIVLLPKLKLTAKLEQKIKTKLHKNASPRHVPAKIFQAPEIPRTLSGKIVELTVRDIINGRQITNESALANPQSLQYYYKIAQDLAKTV